MNVASQALTRSHNGGFTLIELSATVVILGVLAAVALPQFVDLTSSARTSSLEGIRSAVEAANHLTYAKVNSGSGVCPVAGRADLIDVDLDDNGSCETRLKWRFLDNTDIEDRIYLTGDFSSATAGFDRTYIGYDLDGSGSPINDNCYFLYTQANNDGDSPGYEVIGTGC